MQFIVNPASDSVNRVCEFCGDFWCYEWICPGVFQCGHYEGNPPCGAYAYPVAQL